MEQIEGSVDSIVFQSDDGRFSVFRLLCRAAGRVTAVYRGQAPYLGEQLRASGEWQEHSKFGRQFSVVSYEASKPSSRDGVEKFLGSGAIRGIGKVTASRIVEYFGDAALEILQNDPLRLAEVSGIGKKRAEEIAAAFADLSDIRELMLFLEAHGVSGNFAPKLQAAYGENAIAYIKTNPYALIGEIDRIGFKAADRLALALGFSVDSEERLQAGIAYALTSAAQGGHTCVPEELLLQYAARILGTERIALEKMFKKLLERDMLRTVEFGGQCLVYPEYLYQAECRSAKYLLRLARRPASLGIVNTKLIMEEWELEAGIELAAAQREAVNASLQYGVLALTGGPGTGKTTVIKGILAVLERAGCKVMLAAPTGRAARRLAEAAGKPAKTVHRLLEYDAAGRFGRSEENPLEAQAVIVDEASMLDIVLTYRLLDALPVGCRLVLVGDVDQLPSVGAGSVLKDIIRCGQLPVVRLTEVFRQAEISPIVRNAHRINQGEMPECEAGSDFALTEEADENKAAQCIIEVYAHMAEQSDSPQGRLQAWQDAQVLSPMHKGPCGVQNLNKLLQARLNPPSPLKNEISTAEGTLRLGDKVMQIRNNYTKDVYNGDIGRIVELTQEVLKVWFAYKPDGEFVSYDKTEIDELQLAYAMSVHKSQGSEYPRVILAMVPSHYIMLQRNLLYTAVTRARQQVLIVGRMAAVRTAVMNDRTRRRYSLLAERLQENGEIQ